MKMNILKIIVAILLSSITYSQSIETSYKIPFNSMGNMIELKINNQYSETLRNIKVEASGLPEWITLRNSEVLINEIESHRSSTASFTFDIEKAAPSETEENISFIITDESGKSYYKNIYITISAPDHFELLQNYPNPFNPTTTIAYQIPASLNPSKGGTSVSLKVFDILGRDVETLVNEEKTPGYYEVIFNAEKYASGIYFYSLITGSYSNTKKFIIMK